MKYQWLKDDEEPLSDGNDYEGSTTSELTIVGTGPQVRGNYKCLVKHKYGKVLSNATHYGKCLHLYTYNYEVYSGSILPPLFRSFCWSVVSERS